MREKDWCDTCKEPWASEQCNTCKYGYGKENNYVPMTNADRIRGMSDEELATFLFNNVSCSDCTMHGGGCSIDCEKWMLSWLKAPVEVDK